MWTLSLKVLDGCSTSLQAKCQNSRIKAPEEEKNVKLKLLKAKMSSTGNQDTNGGYNVCELDRFAVADSYSASKCTSCLVNVHKC